MTESDFVLYIEGELQFHTTKKPTSYDLARFENRFGLPSGLIKRVSVKKDYSGYTYSGKFSAALNSTEELLQLIASYSGENIGFNLKLQEYSFEDVNGKSNVEMQSIVYANASKSRVFTAVIHYGFKMNVDNTIDINEFVNEVNFKTNSLHEDMIQFKDIDLKTANLLCKMNYECLEEYSIDQLQFDIECLKGKDVNFETYLKFIKRYGKFKYRTS